MIHTSPSVLSRMDDISCRARIWWDGLGEFRKFRESSTACKSCAVMKKSQ